MYWIPRIGRPIARRWPIGRAWRWIIRRTIAWVIAGIITAPPVRIAVINPAATVDTAATPTHAPAPIAPAAGAATNRGPHGNPYTERNDGGRDNLGSGVAGSRNRGAVDNGRVIRRDIHNLWIGRLDYDHLGAFLDDFYLLAGVEIASCFGLRAQALHGRHHGLLLGGRGIAQGRSPGNILGHIRKHRGELRQGLDRGIPSLRFNGAGKCVALKCRIAFQEVSALITWSGYVAAP